MGLFKREEERPKKCKKTRCIQCIVTTDFSLAFILAIVLPAVVVVVISWCIEIHFHGVGRMQGSKEHDTRTGALRSNLAPNLTYYEDRMNAMLMHPIAMTAGFFMLPAYSIMLYRACCCYSRDNVCYVHSALSLLSLAIGVLGYVLVQRFYSDEYGTEALPLQTFHSIMGIVVIVATFLQSLAGVIIFVCVRKAALLPTAMFRFEFATYHFHIGVSIFLGGVVAVVTGLSHLPLFAYPPLEKALTVEPGVSRYRDAMKSLANCHVVVALSTVCVYYVMTKDDFRIRGRIMMARD